jgi:hypothetical protein
MRTAGQKLKAISLALLAASTIAAAFFWRTPFALAGVQITADVCDTSDATETTVEGNWVGPLYQVVMAQPENCAMVVDKSAVQRIGHHLFVRTTFTSPSGMYTGCHCQHRTTLGVSGLPRQAYSIHVYSWP